MRNTVVGFFSGLVVAFALLFSTHAISAAPPEAHPEIQAAIAHLQEAKGNLERGAHDFGGHRVKALEHTNQALAECNAALRYDRK